MVGVRRLAVLLLIVATPAHAGALTDTIRVELNSLAASEQKCRLSFVLKNEAFSDVQSLKLDLVLFDRQGVIGRRLIAEMGPLRAAKTVVKSFDVDEPCTNLGSVLVNDAADCAPEQPASCLDRLTLSSHVADIRLFK